MADVVTSDGLVLATDASVAGTKLGLGWLSNQGHYGALFQRHPESRIVGSDSTTIGELRAVAYALRHIRPSGRFLLLVDSRAAGSFLGRWLEGDLTLPSGYPTTRPSPAPPSLVRLAGFLACGAGHVDVRWVPGHKGHPLNEGADSLAKLAQRNEFSGQKARDVVEMIARRRVLDYQQVEPLR
ncbi:RNase H family protein [Micromonospora sp. CPCC 206061]|uniref:RNase H family protein n=1 Tax=Micromonospora sp. CPCC 206061 TaxID=3122410 RepID=UPI002FF2E773